jgi:metal-responsive CopG/Arc/MetJ family transcriptional regulator
MGLACAKAIRVNITVPEPLLKMIDRYVAEHPGESRSGILVRGAQAIINR